MEITDNKDLFVSLIAGHQPAFATIYHSHFSELFRYTRSILSDKDEAEEIVQDIFENLWTRRESLPELTSLRAYLFKMARYKVTDRIRHSQVKKRYEEHYLLFESIYDSAPEGTNTEEFIQLMEKGISELPARCRETIQLRFHENLSYKDIATRMNVSVKTVEKQLGKAFEYIRGLRTQTEVLLLGGACLQLILG